MIVAHDLTGYCDPGMTRIYFDRYDVDGCLNTGR